MMTTSYTLLPFEFGRFQDGEYLTGLSETEPHHAKFRCNSIMLQPRECRTYEYRLIVTV